MKKILKAIGTMMLIAIIGIGALCAYDLYEDYQAKYKTPELKAEGIETVITEDIIEEEFVYETTWEEATETWD